MGKIFRQFVELDLELKARLDEALKRRAVQLSARAGVEVRPQFAAWLRDQARATIEAYGPARPIAPAVVALPDPHKFP